MSSLEHKPDTSKANVCPPLPTNASGFDKLIYWLGIGFGSGLPKKAPGTWGTLGGTLASIPMILLGFYPFIIITILASLIGIWICHRTSQLMKVHDDPHIVWDEWVGIWIAILPIAYHFSHSKNQQLSYLLTNVNFWMLFLLSFITFRFFDILKPFPINFLDKKLDGGLGIMLDDIVAGLFSCIIVTYSPSIYLWIAIFIFGYPPP